MNKHIKKAIKKSEGQSSLANKLGCTQAFVSLMLHELKPIPAEMCRKIEFINDDEESTAEQILPQVFEKITSL